ncbi:MAG: KH domain-containing protein [Chloroflexota bacterium]|nr:KH domain-containing protein [Chloroflexota bacterium]
MEALVEYVAKSLVDDPTAVKVRRRESGGTVIIELRVAQEDAGRIIGKGGRVANAIRSLLRVEEANLKGKRVVLKIV